MKLHHFNKSSLFIKFVLSHNYSTSSLRMTSILHWISNEEFIFLTYMELSDPKRRHSFNRIAIFMNSWCAKSRWVLQQFILQNGTVFISSSSIYYVEYGIRTVVEGTRKSLFNCPGLEMKIVQPFDNSPHRWNFRDEKFLPQTGSSLTF